ncbi:MAG: hypothetical protein E7158_02315 [Firmicutes bacterium]|nr:hypothetical protein [Bacillota bacterium]
MTETERHNKVLKKIIESTSEEELLDISFINIVLYLQEKLKYKRKMNRANIKKILTSILNHCTFISPDVREDFISIVKENYPNVELKEIEKKYVEIVNEGTIDNLLQEISLKNQKLYEIEKETKKKAHEEVIKSINMCFELKDLPKVGLSELNRHLLKAVNSNDFYKKYKTNDIKELTSAYLNGAEIEEIKTTIDNIVFKTNIPLDKVEKTKEQIFGALISDYEIDYILEEMSAKEKRKEFIYKNDHEYTMEAIKNAKRISQLPDYIVPSSLTTYLSGNATIYSNDNRIKGEDLRQLAKLLLMGYKFEDEVVINELENIIISKYPDKKDAFKLLYNKLSNLPKTYYLVEEMNYFFKKEKEFIKKSSSNVNLYLLPSKKSPVEGGKFYTCFINRGERLDLIKSLPENYEEMDEDVIEAYAQENIDESFKKTGGIIIKRDETIGNVNIFRPNDGTISITPEEKQKVDQISDLDKEIEEKRSILESTKKELEERKRQDEQIKEVINDYERKALALQSELIKQIAAIKGSFGYTNEQGSVLKRINNN